MNQIVGILEPGVNGITICANERAAIEYIELRERGLSPEMAKAEMETNSGHLDDVVGSIMTSNLSHKYGYFTVEHDGRAPRFIPGLSDRQMPTVAK